MSYAFISYSRQDRQFVQRLINLPVAGGRFGEWGGVFWRPGGNPNGGPTCAHKSELARNGKHCLHPQHSIEIIRQWYHRQHHGANHEAFLSLGCAPICWHSLRKTCMTG
jgi:hypothetical protein